MITSYFKKSILGIFLIDSFFQYLDKKYTFIHKPSNSLKESLSSFEMDFVSDNKYWVYNVYACYCHTQNTELIIYSMQTLCWFKSFRRWISMNVTLLGPQPIITKFIYKCYGIDNTLKNFSLVDHMKK